MALTSNEEEETTQRFVVVQRVFWYEQRSSFGFTDENAKVVLYVRPFERVLSE